ncbi:hypothetical protein ACR6C2_42580 [Streptomyces sp. INA 01156]
MIYPVLGGRRRSRPSPPRPRRTRPATRPGSAPYCGPRTRRTGDGCSRRCWARWS